MSKIKNGGSDQYQYGKVSSLNGVIGERVKILTCTELLRPTSIFIIQDSYINSHTG